MKSGMVEVWRGRNGQRKEKLSEAVDNVVELRAIKKREFYEERTGCKISQCSIHGADQSILTMITVSPLSLLKNPMILMAVVGFGFVVGMPYLLDSSMSPSIPSQKPPPQYKNR